MKHLILTLALITSLPFMGRSQTYYTSDIVDSCRAVFARTFGEESLKHYQFVRVSYSYNNWWGTEKSKSFRESDDEKIKDITYARATVVYQHPQLDTFDLKIRFTVNFWDSIHPTFFPDMNRMPLFARKGEPCNWLFETEIEDLQDSLPFEKSIMNFKRSLTYDDNYKQYVWRIDGRYAIKEQITYYERFVVNVVTGEVLAHEFIKQHPKGHFI
ncbi:MAG: hypothetical protein SchgKO_10770 [Schleiferiaceae bacterium]